MDRHRMNLVILLILASGWCFVSQFHSVFANLPSVDSPVPWPSGTHTMLNITVHHDTTALPLSDHYISQIEIDIDETPKTVNLSPPQPQYSFVVQYDMGEITGTPTVKAKAHCTYHSWGGFSPSVTVPEFSVAQLLSIFTIVSAAFLILRQKLPNARKSRRIN